MFNARLPLALPFAALAVYSGCSSSSSIQVETHSSSSSTGTSSSSQSVASSSSVGSSSRSSSVAASSSSSTPVPTGPVVPAGAKAIATTGTTSAAILQIIGITSDDYIVYFDAKGGISASDINGNITQVAPGPPDGGLGPVAAGLGGNILAVLTDYTTKSVSGTTEPVSGTLSIWSHTQTGGVLKQVATKATGIINVATDSSYLIYLDGSDSTGTKGNIGVVSGAGTGATDLVTGVEIDTSATTTTCAPWAVVDGGYVVTSACPLVDGGISSTAKPTITSFNSASSWSATTLATGAAPSTPYAAPYVVDFVTDTAGVNVLTLVGSTLTSQGIASTTGTQLATNVGAPANGEESFYLSPTSTFALFLDSTGALHQSTYATPTTAPTTATVPSSGEIYGLAGVSPDGKWDVDFTGPYNASAGYATALSLRDLSTGAATVLQSAANVNTFGQANLFTPDSKYVIFTSDLGAVPGGDGTYGSLITQSVAANSTPNTIAASTQLVWDAAVLTGDNLIYDDQYTVSTLANANLPGTGNIYVASAAAAGPGTEVVTGADLPNDGFYLTADKSHLFFSFTQFAAADGGYAVFPTDGIYVIALPTP